MIEVNDILLLILQRARALISRKRSWIKRFLAKNRAGYYVSPFDEKVCAFCATGALNRAVNDVVVEMEEEDLKGGILLDKALDEIGKSLHTVKYGRMDLSLFNDLASTDHEDVLALFDNTIDRIQKEAGA